MVCEGGGGKFAANPCHISTLFACYLYACDFTKKPIKMQRVACLCVCVCVFKQMYQNLYIDINVFLKIVTLGSWALDPPNPVIAYIFVTSFWELYSG